MAAAAAYLDGMNEFDEDTSVSARPNLLILYNPVIDNGPGGFGHDRVADYWEKISPMHNITGYSPPVLFMVGDRDRLVPVETAEKFKSKVAKGGSECRLIVYPDQPHGFFNYRGGDNPHYFKTLDAVIAFMRDYGYIQD